MLQSCRARSLGFGQRLAAKHMRNFVRVYCDETRGALALERAEPLLHLRGRQAEPAVPGELDGDEIAIRRVGGGAGRDRELAAKLFLVDGLEPPTTVR